MTDLIIVLALVAGIVVVALVAPWPGRGLWSRLRRRLATSERVLVEDALKHLYDCETRRLPVTVQSVAGALERSANRAAAVLDALQRRELVAAGEKGYRLTPVGRTYALRVVRIHRLWERYLSDETGFAAEEWHHVAEHREHRTSPEQADALARRMGYPRYDPHGDPIPTKSGEVAPPAGEPLTAFGPGEGGEIAHVEDEPHATYRRLLAEGLHAGMQVRVVSVSPDAVEFEADGRRRRLSPVAAGNLSVRRVPVDDVRDVPAGRLSHLAPGQSGRVAGISPACRGPQRRRLLDLGLVPGTVVAAELRSPGGDPTAYRIRGALIALRREQADLVHVERDEARGGAAS